MAGSKYDTQNTDYASRKHSQPIKQYNFGHVQCGILINCAIQIPLLNQTKTKCLAQNRALFYLVYKTCTKKLAQESKKLEPVDLYKLL